MTYLENITIKNFRGFDSLEIDEFSKINLFLGKNNSGKTSVLESLFLLLGMSNPMLPNRVNQIRGLNFGSSKQLKYIFHNLKLENKPYFQGKFSDSSERILELEARSQQSIESKEFPETNASTSIAEVTGIDLNFSIKKRHESKKPYKSSLVFENNNLSQNIAKGYSESLYASFIPPDSKNSGALIRYHEILKKKEGEAVLQSLQSFDKNIKNVQPLDDGIYFDIDGIEELVPSNIMGDGIRRFLNVVTAVSEKQNSFICIDEIENGLHYSAYKLLWKSIISLVNLHNVQLFISTHNVEVLSCLKSVLENSDFASMQEFTKVFTIANTAEAGYKAYKYSFEGFKDAIEQDIEIRS